MALAVVRSMDAPRQLRTAQESEDFEQELVDQYLLASVGAGVGDGTVAGDRRVICEFMRFVGRPVWAAGPEDADRFLAHQRKDCGWAPATVQVKAWALASFYEFLIGRYQGDIHALTGHVLVQPIDKFNGPPKATYSAVRVPPSEVEVDALFGGWRAALPDARKYLPAVRDYFAASLWRRAGLRINETEKLDVKDWRPDLGVDGRLHLDGRVILLAPQVEQRLRAYLDVRDRRWPLTANPHLFITQFTARRISPVTSAWVNKTLGMTAQSIREDRILDEARESGGDVRRLCALFGVSVGTALRYTATLGHPGLTEVNIHLRRPPQ
ncbi:hypothetical protein [Streptacidiphilus sp. MAP5-3]|uniref:hypothetical protein n=1 Tax=unclassified Streptacidiphilus TaxID=2643834 RepID=UPI00351767A5